MRDVTLPVSLQTALRAAVVSMESGSSGVAQGDGMHNYGMLLLAHLAEAVDYMAVWMEELTGCARTVFRGYSVLYPPQVRGSALLLLVVGPPTRQRKHGMVLRVRGSDDKLFVITPRPEPSDGLRVHSID